MEETPVFSEKTNLNDTRNDNQQTTSKIIPPSSMGNMMYQFLQWLNNTEEAQESENVLFTPTHFQDQLTRLCQQHQQRWQDLVSSSEKTGDDGHFTLKSTRDSRQSDHWGPSGWQMLHIQAECYPLKPSQKHQQMTLIYLLLFAESLPCPHCSRHFLEGLFLGNDPVAPALQSRDEFRQWLHRFHNQVNFRLGKKQMTLEKAMEKWGRKQSSSHSSLQQWFNETRKKMSGILSPPTSLQQPLVGNKSNITIPAFHSQKKHTGEMFASDVVHQLDSQQQPKKSNMSTETLSPSAQNTNEQTERDQGTKTEGEKTIIILASFIGILILVILVVVAVLFTNKKKPIMK